MLSFDPKRDPLAPRDAATVIVLRDGTAGLEVFCVHRHAASSFLGGAVVFPGGKVEPGEGGDEAKAWAELASAPHPRSEAFATAQASARTLAVAACRETLEEGGIVPTDRALSAADVAALRAELLAAPPASAHEGALPPLAAALARRGHALRLDALVPWARWVTPAAEARRFDARFFLLALPAGQEGRHDDHETTQSFWAQPTAVLDRFARGEIFLAPPTTRSLELLASAQSCTAALALAGAQSLEPICPLFVPGEPPFLALPGDPAHATPLRRVPGPTRFVLQDGRFVSAEPPVEPSANVPSPPTATGTPGETRFARRSP